jgi:hypothetical protein
MTTVAAPPPVDVGEAVLQILRESGQPLKIAEIQKLYQGPKFAKGALKDLLDEKLLQGVVFLCPPAGKQARYWTRDEVQLIHEQVECLLGSGPKAETQLVKDTVAALGKATSAKAVKEALGTMRKDGRVHAHPGKGKTAVLGLQPYDPVAALTFKAATLNDLKQAFGRMRAGNVSMERFLRRVGELVAPDSVGEPAPRAEPVSAEPVSPPKDAGAANLEAARAEVRGIVQKALQEAGPGAPVSVPELRQQMPAEYRGAEIFDKTVWDLVEEGVIFPERHNQPGSLGEAEKAALLHDEQGRSYVYIASRD